MSPNEIANQLLSDKEKIILIYAFNATGKTRLSMAYKDVTKKEDGTHSGIYFNAYSEDLFVWNNDHENEGEPIQLIIRESSLNRFHASLSEDEIRQKIKPYRPKFDFSFHLFPNPERGIQSISFYSKTDDEGDSQQSIKISRGEERIFVWCFFLAMFEIEGWSEQQSSLFFIDDPVSSLDDHNIFITVATLYDLVEKYFKKRKLIITAHHIGLVSILSDWLKKGDNQKKFNGNIKSYILTSRSEDGLQLTGHNKDVMLYHLRILQVLESARNEDNVTAYHFALLRQALENISSFLGKGQFSYVLNQIGIDDVNEVAAIVNTLSHKKTYYYESELLTPDNRKLFDRIMNGLMSKYNFSLN